MLIPNNLVMIVTKMENGCSSLSEQRESERERKRETKNFLVSDYYNKRCHMCSKEYARQKMSWEKLEKYNLYDRERINTHEVDLFDFFGEKRTNSLV